MTCSHAPRLPQVFSGGDAAKPLKVTLSASAAAQPRGWEAGLLGMRKGGVRYVAVSAAAVATEIQGRGEAGPGGARLYCLEVLKMKRSGGTSKEASSSAPDATVASMVATEGEAAPDAPATSPLPTSTPPTPATPPPADPPPAPLAAESAITATTAAAPATDSPPRPAAAADEAQQDAASTEAAANADMGGVQSEAASGFAAARAIVAGVVGGEKSGDAAKVTACPHPHCTVTAYPHPHCTLAAPSPVTARPPLTPQPLVPTSTPPTTHHPPQHPTPTATPPPHPGCARLEDGEALRPRAITHRG